MPRQAKRGTVEFEKCEFKVDMRRLAVDCIALYFCNKQWFCGGPIPKAELFCDSNLKTVMRTRFDKRWEVFVHGQCLPLIPNTEGYDIESVTWEIHSLLRILDEMGQLWIPAYFRPGMVLLHFKICWGVKIPPPPLL